MNTGRSLVTTYEKRTVCSRLYLGILDMELRNNWRERKLNFQARGVKPEK